MQGYLIYDSLNSVPTEDTIKIIKQLSSSEDSMPPFTQHECFKQVRGTDSGVFAIAYAVEVLNGNDPQLVRFDQSKLRGHLVCCLENNKLTPFPQYRNINDGTHQIKKISSPNLVKISEAD